MWVLEWRRAERLASGRLYSIVYRLGQQPGDQELKRRAALARLRTYSDADLDRHFWHLRNSGDPEQYWTEYEPCLIEMARRKMASELAEHYRSLLAEAAGKAPPEHPHNLEMLTALRRAEGNPDPLAVTLFVHDSNSVLGNNGSVSVTTQLHNVDVAQESVLLWKEGRERCQWMFTLTDQEGKQVTPLGSLPTMISSVFDYAPRLAGQTRCGDVFDLRSYLVPPKPGRYYLQAFYCNDLNFACDGFETQIFAKSEPLRVEVKNPDYGRLWPAASIPPPLAIFSACAVMVLASMRGSTTERSTILALGISRRDFRWGMLFLLLGLGMCATLPDADDYDAANLRLTANWTMRPVYD
jgi:hypothetical protein